MQPDKDNKIFQILKRLKLSNSKSIKVYHNKTRDRSDIKVFYCKKSGVFFLSSTKHLEKNHYENKKDYGWFANNSRTRSLNKYSKDDIRRKKQFKKYIKNKNWLDIGTGTGGILELLKKESKSISAIEPISFARNKLNKLGFKTYDRIENIDKSKNFDVVTLFHVFEHLVDPINTLKEIKTRMKKDGKLIIEVPHANDFLISFLDLDEFKNFTFWSEHLILHTKKSLEKFLKHTGFQLITMYGFQRYSFKNHLYWIKEKKPEGEKYLKGLEVNSISVAYNKFLEDNNFNDTIICIAKKID